MSASGPSGPLVRDLGSKGKILYRELSQLFSGIWGDQCIIFRDQGSTDPPGGPHQTFAVYLRNNAKPMSYFQKYVKKNQCPFI